MTLSTRHPTESLGWNGLQALTSQLEGRLTGFTPCRYPSDRRELENDAAFFEDDLRYILAAKPVIAPFLEEKYKQMDKISLDLLGALDEVVNQDLVKPPDGQDYHESESPGYSYLRSLASNYKWLAAILYFLKTRPRQSFGLATGPGPSLFKFPSDGYAKKAKACAQQWRAFLDGLAAEAARSQSAQIISLEAIGLPGELNNNQSDMFEKRASGVVDVLFREFWRLNCADLRTHEIRLRLSGLYTDPAQSILDMLVSRCPNATSETWHEARCGPFSIVIDNTEKQSLCGGIDHAIIEQRKLHLLVNQHGLFNVTDKMPELPSSLANFKVESLAVLFSRNLFKRFTGEDIRKGVTKEKVSFKEKAEIALMLARCLLDFFDDDIELASYSWTPEQIFFLKPSSTTLATRGEIYVSLRPRRCEVKSADLDLLNEFRPGNPILLSFARLLLEIETGEEIQYPEGGENVENWGFLCFLVQCKKDNKESPQFMDAVEGCLHLCKNLPKSEDRVTGSAASRVLRMAIYEKIIRKLEIITNPQSSKRKAQLSESECPPSKNTKLSTTRFVEKLPVVAVACPERSTIIPISRSAHLAPRSKLSSGSEQPSFSETSFSREQGELNQRAGRFYGRFDGRFTNLEARTDQPQPRTFGDLNWTWASRFEPKESDDAIKIAILDTGINLLHKEFQRMGPVSAEKDISQIERMPMNCRKSFCGTDENDVQDLDGHGTQVASIILRLAPRAELCIARICHGDVKHGNSEGEKPVGAKESYIQHPQPEIVENAINWAIDQKVNIINLSFGFDNDDRGIDDALERAREAGILIFAAMSNGGMHVDAAWPARQSKDAIGIHSCIDEGKQSSIFTPRRVKGNPNFMTVGEGIIAPTLKQDFCVVDGTSFATPVVVAMAALILEFANQSRCQKLRQESNKIVRVEELGRNWGMSRVLEAISKKSTDGYLWISPKLLWEGFRDNDVDNTTIAAREHAWKVICEALTK